MKSSHLHLMSCLLELLGVNVIFNAIFVTHTKSMPKASFPHVALNNSGTNWTKKNTEVSIACLHCDLLNKFAAIQCILLNFPYSMVKSSNLRVFVQLFDCCLFSPNNVSPRGNTESDLKKSTGACILPTDINLRLGDNLQCAQNVLL